MKLFAFYPDGHGPLSMFVAAETEELAKEAVLAHIDSKRREHPHDWDYDYQGGNLDLYTIEAVDPGVVLVNENS